MSIDTFGRPIGEVWDELVAELKKRGFVEESQYSKSFKGAEESFSIFWPMTRETTFPRYHFLACYVVTGGSEGYWLHVEAIMGEKNTTLLLGKTLNEGAEGKRDAWELARNVADILGA